MILRRIKGHAASELSLVALILMAVLYWCSAEIGEIALWLLGRIFP